MLYFIIFFLLLNIKVIFSPSPILADSVWTKNPSNPQIQKGPSGSWDSRYVNPGSVLFDNNEYKMWYSGVNSQSLTQIGLATSNDGIVWKKSDNNPVLRVGLDWDKKEVKQPHVIKDGDVYKMWYMGYDGTNEKYQIGYATSSDGFTWEKDQLNPIFTPSTSGWDSRGISEPSIVKIGDKYHMWYSGITFGSTEPRWKIGYALSDDGIKWDKYSGNPVLKVDQSWEHNIGDGVNSPFVYYDGYFYHMWYHSNGIGYAVSLDGKIWTKYQYNPIIPLGNGSEWDNFFIVDPTFYKESDSFKIWYAGEQSHNNFKIGLAEATELPEILPPPPPPESPIVIIPGLGASWNEQDVLSCKLENSGKWDLAPNVKVYDSLKKTLVDQGLTESKDFQFYFYDWRQPLDVQIDKFKEYLDNLLTNYQPGSKARLLGHSLGGLLIRGYLEKYPNSKKIYKAMTIGTPHQGTLYAYPLWEAGINWINDIGIKTRLALLINFCRFKTTPSPVNPKFNQFLEITFPGNMFKSTREIVQSLAPIIKTLLPSFNYLKLKGTEIESTELIHQNDWLLIHPFPTPVYRELTHTLSGTNKQTLRYINIEKPKGNKNGNWADGKPKSKENIKEGDDTVLNMSSMINGLNNIVIEGSHNQIISSAEGIDKILEFLGIEKVAKIEEFELPEEKAETAVSLMIEGDAQMTLTDPTSRSIASEGNLIIAYDPIVGNYLLNITSGRDETALLNVNFIDKSEEENTFSYKIRLKKEKESRFNINLNPRSKKKIQLSER